MRLLRARALRGVIAGAGLSMAMCVGIGSAQAQSVVCWGADLDGQCSVPEGLGTDTSVAAGGNRTVARICVTPILSRTSGNLGAIGFGKPREFTFNLLPTAAGAAMLTISVRRDLNLATEYFTLKLDGVPQTSLLFVNGANDCPTMPGVATVTIPLKQLSALNADGARTVRIEASSLVSGTQCVDGLCEISLRYESAPFDCNGNALPDTYEIALNPSKDCDDVVLDSCEIAAGAQDKDLDGIPDDWEYPRGDFNLDGDANAADLAVLLALWGVTNAPFGDLNGLGQIGGAELPILLANWGPY